MTTETISTPFGPVSFTFHQGAGAPAAPDGGKHAGAMTVESATDGLPPAIFQLTYGDRAQEAKAYIEALKNHLPYRQHVREALPDFAWQSAKSKQLKRNAELLQPFLFTLVPLKSGSELGRLYETIGRLNTDAARERLLSELERPGLHTYVNDLLQGLLPYRDEDTLHRLLTLYPKFSRQIEPLVIYFYILRHFRAPEIVELANRALKDHPEEVAAIVRLYQKNGLTPKQIATTLRTDFDAEQRYEYLDILLGATNEVGVADYHISLTALNEKLAAEVFTDTSPMAWSQQLPKHWRELVFSSPAEEVTAVVTDYLHRPEPRLQRNALLQLKLKIKDETYRTTFPVAPLEDRLRELISSRFDKISTVTLHVTEKLFDRFTEPEKMVRALFAEAFRSRYRLMVSAALRAAAGQEELAALQVSLLKELIEGAKTEANREAVEKFLPYVRFLNDREDYRRQVGHRERTE